LHFDDALSDDEDEQDEDGKEKKPETYEKDAPVQGKLLRVDCDRR